MGTNSRRRDENRDRVRPLFPSRLPRLLLISPARRPPEENGEQHGHTSYACEGAEDDDNDDEEDAEGREERDADADDRFKQRNRASADMPVCSLASYERLSWAAWKMEAGTLYFRNNGLLVRIRPTADG